MRNTALVFLLIGPLACQTQVISATSDESEGGGESLETQENQENPTDQPDAEGSTEKVSITVFTESLCPCAAQWVHDLQLHTLPAIGEILSVERYLDGSAEDDGSVWVFHGDQEYLSQKREVCVQALVEVYREAASSKV